MHWYTRDGNPMHYVPNGSKPGAMRETTLRDARKLNLFPSVTTVIKCVDKGDTLIKWQLKQALLAALVHPDGFPRFDGEVSEKDPRFITWAEQCIADARKQVAVKAERGAILHDMMMKAHKEPELVPPQYQAHVEGMFEMLERNFGKRIWIAEGSFACPEGFGGQIDLRTHPDDPDPIVLDYKFKDFDETRDAAYFVYDEHAMQLGGYTIGVRMPTARCFNAFGSISEPGLVLLHEHDPGTIEQGRQMFMAALAFWQAKNRYRPQW